MNKTLTKSNPKSEQVFWIVLKSHLSPEFKMLGEPLSPRGCLLLTRKSPFREASGGGVPVMGWGRGRDVLEDFWAIRCDWRVDLIDGHFFLREYPRQIAWIWRALWARFPVRSFSRCWRAPSERKMCFFPRAQSLEIAPSSEDFKDTFRWSKILWQSSKAWSSLLERVRIGARVLYRELKFLNRILCGNPPAIRFTVSRICKLRTCSTTNPRLNSELDSVSLGRIHRTKWGFAWTRVRRRLSNLVWKSWVRVETGSSPFRSSEYDVGDILKVIPRGTISSE